MSDDYTAASDVNRIDSDDAVLLYDAGCTMCNELAYKVRDRTDDPLQLVALSDPEADELLSSHYSSSWSEDFYFIKGDTVRKGKYALPSVMKMVGLKDFTSLAGDYLRHHQNQSSDCDHEHDHEVENTGMGISRRRFVGATATVGTALFAGTAPASAAPGGLLKGVQVRVARISPDGQGGFDVAIEREDNLVQSKKRGPSTNKASTAAQSSVSMESMGTETLVDQGTLHIQRENLDIQAEADDEILAHARSTNFGGSGIAQMTHYGVLDNRDRYSFSLNFAKGPMEVDGKKTVDTTLSGRVNHDVARKTVDFLKFESDDAEGIATHLKGYVAGMRAYQQHYAQHEDQKMAELYGEMAENLTERASTIAAGTDGEFEPISNVLSISSVPFWTDYVESPTTEDPNRYQTSGVETSGAGCGCSCCAFGCCVGCSCGCSICIGVTTGCGCSCCAGSCGAGCGCGCCYCVTN